jgi:hypothetical protein
MLLVSGYGPVVSLGISLQSPPPPELLDEPLDALPDELLDALPLPPAPELLLEVEEVPPLSSPQPTTITAPSVPSSSSAARRLRSFFSDIVISYPPGKLLVDPRRVVHAAGTRIFRV